MNHLVFFASIALLLFQCTGSAYIGRRDILQATTVEGCNTSPGVNVPTECSGGSASNNDWSKNSIECHIRGGYDLKCEYNHEVIGANKVQCTLNVGAAQNELKYECPVYSNCVISCDWTSLQSLLPNAVYPSVRNIMLAWKPEFELFG